MPKQVERIARTAQEETALSFAAGAITVMGSGPAGRNPDDHHLLRSVGISAAGAAGARDSMRLDGNVLLAGPPPGCISRQPVQSFLESSRLDRSLLAVHDRRDSICLGDFRLPRLHCRRADRIDRHRRGGRSPCPQLPVAGQMAHRELMPTRRRQRKSLAYR